MIIRTREDGFREKIFADTYFINSSQMLRFRICRYLEVQIDGEWRQVPNTFRVDDADIDLRNTQMVNPATGLLDGNGSVGVYDYVMSLKVSDLGGSEDYVFAKIAERIETFLEANHLIL